MNIKEELAKVEAQYSALWEELQEWTKDQGQHLARQEGEMGAELALALHVEAYNLKRQELAQLHEKQLALKAALNVATNDRGSKNEDAQQASSKSTFSVASLPITSTTSTQNDTSLSTLNKLGSPTSMSNLAEEDYHALLAQAEALATKYFVDRRGTNARKWDGLKEHYGQEGLLPLWVADMDFAIAKPIQDALIAKCQDAAMGYSLLSDSYYKAVGEWYDKHFGYYPDQSWFLHAPGAMTGVHWVIQSLLKEDEGVLVFSPLYPPLYNAAKILGRPFFDEPMLQTQQEDGSVYFSLDFDRLETRLKSEKIKCLLLCSPQNPVGRVWTKEELLRLATLAEKYDLLLLVDEMHQDLVANGYQQQAILALEKGRFANRTIAVSSASKTFNLAGFPMSNLLIPNSQWREQVQKFLPSVYLGKPDTLAVEATEVAYREGEPWLADIEIILQANRAYFEREFLRQNPGLRWSVMEGTYLAFVDFGARLSPEQMRTFMLDGCKIAPSFGIDFGKDYGTWVRLNLATSPAILRQAVERLQMGWDFLQLSL